MRATCRSRARARYLVMKMRPHSSTASDTVRLRNPDRVVGVKMSRDAAKASKQLQRWLAMGWDEISVDGGQSWKSLDRTPALISRSTPEPKAPVRLSPDTVGMIRKEHASAYQEAITTAKLLSDALQTTSRDLDGPRSPDIRPLAGLVADLEMAQERARTLRDVLTLLGVVL